MICRKATVALPGANYLSSRLPIPIYSSTKLGFLCFFALRNPRFQAFRAQNRGFCALLGSGTPVFGHLEHKIGVFVLGLLLSVASGRVIADIFEILPVSGRGDGGIRLPWQSRVLL